MKRHLSLTVVCVCGGGGLLKGLCESFPPLFSPLPALLLSSALGARSSGPFGAVAPPRPTNAASVIGNLNAPASSRRELT